MLNDDRETPEPCAFEALRQREFARLDDLGIVYLDYAASALYGSSQVEAHADRLRSGVFGNPHSEHVASRASDELIIKAREATLRFLDADPADYEVVFTANASAAIKLVGEAYPFTAHRGLTLSVDNHNSVVGLREFVRRAGGPVNLLPINPELELQDPLECMTSATAHGGRPGMLAFPYRSNFSGVAHPLELVRQAQALGFDVLLDAAGLGSAGGLSLREHPADFVALSFYKLFGLPTGAGALVARRDALVRLRRPWFAGGAIAYVSVEHDRHRLLPGHAGFEDGTPDFLGAGAIVDGFAFLDGIDSTTLAARLEQLAALLRRRLRDLKHVGGAPAVRLYGSQDADGPVVTFNLLAPDGSVRPYTEVEAAAVKAGLALRGGCFCNPGAAEAAFHLAKHGLSKCFDALGADFTLAGLQQCAPNATIGALRLSVGLPTTHRDLHRATEVIAALV